MDLATVANATSTSTSTSSNISDSGVSQAVAIEVLKKAINIDQENTVALIQAIPQASTTPNLPPHLGNNINTTA